jgi:hypothetical protein
VLLCAVAADQALTFARRHPSAERLPPNGAAGCAGAAKPTY